MDNTVWAGVSLSPCRFVNFRIGDCVYHFRSYLFLHAIRGRSSILAIMEIVVRDDLLASKRFCYLVTPFKIIIQSNSCLDSQLHYLLRQKTMFYSQEFELEPRMPVVNPNN